MGIPKITVITPSFNQGEFLEDAILSVLDQKYANLEYMIVDGGSEDRSVEIIKKYEKYLTYWVSEKDGGQSDAINKGFRRGSGDILAYLNSDDFYLEGALHDIGQAYEAHPNAGLYVGNGVAVDRNKQNPRRYSKTVGFDHNALVKGSCYILQPATFINRKAYERVGELNEKLKYGMDLEYWLRVGQEFHVVVMDEPLAAFRIYEDIKTIQGGFERWVELWGIYRKFTNMQMTPGLLVEFFSILKQPPILNELGMNIKDLVEVGFNTTYALMQKLLNLDDCIPTGKGILFHPKKPLLAPDRAFGNYGTPLAQGADRHDLRRRAPATIQRLGSQPRIDLVLQATGVHAWGVGGGWENAARKLGLFHRTFAPRANWGDREVLEDGGLFAYLANPQADVMLLLGFDWHSQMLHATRRWEEQWLNANMIKVLYVQESIQNSCRLSGQEWMRQVFLRAAGCVDAIVYTDITDRPLMEGTNKPVLWQSFGVDDTIFNSHKPFRERLPKAFFRGKSAAFAGQSQTYRDRRDLIRFLREKRVLDLLEYTERPMTPQDIAFDFNRYQVAVNLPSVFSNHPTRVFEALACGCALVTNRTGLPQIDALFENLRHLIYYSDREELLEAVQRLTADVNYAEELASKGLAHVKENYTLDRHLSVMLNWLDKAEISALRSTTMGQLPSATTSSTLEKRGQILIDGVIFDLQQGRPLGISRVWQALLTCLGHTPLADRILLLDRGSTAPYIPGLRRRLIGNYDHKSFEQDSLYLQQICEEEKAALFISTYHTYPENTHSMILLHDMIPEISGQDLNRPEWRAKAKAIEKACAYCSVSASTLNDFRKLYPHYSHRKTFLTPNAASDVFRPHEEDEITSFRTKYNIQKPYFLLVGHRMLYKNAILFFRAFSLLENNADYEIVCSGGSDHLERGLRRYVDRSKTQVLFLKDEELSTAYSGAICLVYPSQYEGFGLPVLEAQSSGCPVITCRNSSIPEVGGDSVLYVDEKDVARMREALLDIQKPELRNVLIAKGLENVKRFSWKTSGEMLAASIEEVFNDIGSTPLNPSDPVAATSRFIYFIRNTFRDNPVAFAVERIDRTFRGEMAMSPGAVLECERIIGNMKDEMVDWLGSEIRRSELNDASLYYSYALALGRRYQLKEALDFYLKACKEASEEWKKCRWKVGYRAAEVAQTLGLPSVAAQLLKEVVLLDNPLFAEGKVKLEEVNRELVEVTSESSMEKELDERTCQSGSEDWVVESVPSKDPNNPLVSAIVSTYNAEQFIYGCMEDLERQTIAGRLEIIVVNAGSKQDEETVIRRFMGRYSNIVYVKSQRRRTLSEAWNQAIKMARGKYITTANTDDRHRHDGLERMAEALETRPEVALVYADVAITHRENENFDSAHVRGYYRWPDFDPRLLFQICYVGPQPMWRRQIHERYGHFDPASRSAGDYEFWLRIARTETFLHIPEVLGLYYLSETGTEHKNMAMSFRESEKARDRYWPPEWGTRPTPFFNKNPFADSERSADSGNGLKERARLLKQQGITFYNWGDRSGAESAFKQALILDSRDADVLVSMGKLCYESKRHEEALSYLERAVRENPGDKDAHIGIALAAYEMNDLTTCQRAYEKARRLDPSHPVVQSLDRLFASKKRGDLSKKDRTASATFHDPKPFNDLGESLFNEGKVEEAREQFLKSLNIDERYVPSINNLGVVYFQQGRIGDAVQFFQRALEIRPGYAEAAENLQKCQEIKSNPSGEIQSA